MRTVALTCNQCGAGLQLDEEVRFVTCKHCGSRLEVQHTGDAAYTTVLERVDAVARVADGTAAEVERIKIEREIEKLNTMLGELDDPGGFGVVALCAGMAFLGLLGVLISDDNDNELRFSSMGFMIVLGLMALFLGWGLRAQIATYKSRRTDVLALRDACRAKLYAVTMRPASMAGDATSEDRSPVLTQA